jgi:hypothetical protein
VPTRRQDAPAPSTLAEAVQAVRAQQPEIGVNKLVSEIKRLYPNLEADGVKFGVRTNLTHARVACRV